MPSIYKEVGEHVRARRKKIGMTLESLGDASSVPAAFIGQIERDVKKASLKTLAALAQALGIPVGDLFSKEPFNVLPLEKEIDAIMRSSSPKEKKILMLALRSLAHSLKTLR
jgi:transcriptional regulator with XRE-family HTH domain